MGAITCDCLQRVGPIGCRRRYGISVRMKELPFDSVNGKPGQRDGLIQIPGGWAARKPARA